MGTMYLIVLFICITCTICTNDIFYVNHWDGAFQGTFIVHADNAVHGWRARLTFDAPVDTIEIWKAQLVQKTGANEFLVESMPWDSDLFPGEDLEIEFIVHHSGRGYPPNGHYTIEASGASGGFGTLLPLIPDLSNVGGQTSGGSTSGSSGGSGGATLLPLIPDLSNIGGQTSGGSTSGGLIPLVSASSTSVRPTSGAPTSGVLISSTSGVLIPLVPDISSTGGSSGSNTVTSGTNVPTTQPPFVQTTNQAVSPISPGTARPTGSGSSMKYDYGTALGMSILFYDAQRSGKLPSNNPIPWRGDSAVNDADGGHDLSGGWYDAGDHVKFNLPMAYSTWMLEWGFLKFSDAYVAAGQKDMMCDMIKWPLDYFLKCWIPDQKTLYVQVGDGNQDHSFWGRPENMRMNRPAFKVTQSCPGSDVSAATAAALAAGSLVFSDICGDAGYGAKLLGAARSLYSFAKSYRGIYTSCVNQAASFYGSTSDADDLSVAASFLHMATKDNQYLSDAKNFEQSGERWALSWDDSMVAADLLLYELTQDDKYKNAVTGFVNSYMPGGSVSQTPCGLAYRDQWGANRYAANAAFIATVAAADGIEPDKYKTWAMSQINYMLGDNKYHMSYEVGFGGKYPEHAHHRGSSCRTDSDSCSIGDPGPNPNLLKGALVGGPDNGDNYNDRRDDYVKNEVACDYNAGFQGTLAGLLHFAENSDLPKAPPAKC